MATQPTGTFGPAYDPKLDRQRITTQMQRVRDVFLAYSIMSRWLTLYEAQETLEATYGKRFPEASISAQLRHLRKPQFGGFQVEKRRRGEELPGLWEYRVYAKVMLPPEQLRLI